MQALNDGCELLNSCFKHCMYNDDYIIDYTLFNFMLNHFKPYLFSFQRWNLCYFPYLAL